jgi:hypothetical protein
MTIHGGWLQHRLDAVGEWFQGEEVPFNGAPSLAIRVARPISNMILLAARKLE